MFCSLSKLKSSRLKVPSSRFDLSTTGICGANFGLADGARCLDVHDDAELHINQIIVRIRKECRSAQGSRPLGGGIGRRDELWHHVAGRPERRVIKRGEILFVRAAYRLCIKLFVPQW